MTGKVCARHTQERAEYGRGLAKEGCVNVGAGEMPRSVFNPKPLLLNVGCTWE